MSGGQKSNIHIAEPNPPWRKHHQDNPSDRHNPYAALQSLMIPDSASADNDDQEEKERLIKSRKYQSPAPRSWAQVASSAPVAPISGSVSHRRSAPLITMRGTIDGYPARVLIDCGASCNYISERLVSRYQLRTKTFHPPLTIELADGSQSKTSEELLKQRVVLPGLMVEWIW